MMISWSKKATALILVLMFVPAILAAQESMTLTGKVGEGFKFVADDGTVYEIGATDMGDELAAHVGKRAKVTGKVAKEDDAKIIAVESFELIE